MTAAISPGTYIRKCRERAGLSLDDVALRTDTIPAVSARTRAEWLAKIEDGTAPISIGTAIALSRVIPFDANVLDALMAIDAGATGIKAPEICLHCGCSEEDPCLDRVTREFCAWTDAKHNRCTSCVGKDPAPAERPETAEQGDRIATAPPHDPDQALAELPPEVTSASTGAMLQRLGLLNTPLGREELAQILTSRDWSRNSFGFWQRPSSQARAA